MWGFLFWGDEPADTDTLVVRSILVDSAEHSVCVHFFMSACMALVAYWQSEQHHIMQMTSRATISMCGNMGTYEHEARVADVGRREAALQRVHHDQAARGAALYAILLHYVCRFLQHCSNGSNYIT